MDIWTIYLIAHLAVAWALYFFIFGHSVGEGKRPEASWHLAGILVCGLWPISAAAVGIWLLWDIRNKLDPIPRITDWIIRHAQKTPYEHIGDQDGLYMGRWWVFNAEWWLSNWRKFDRRWLFWMPAIRLHHTVKSDADRHLHDHPWPNVSILLRGCYYEMLPLDQKQDPALDGDPTCHVAKLRLPLIPVFRKATDRHRLIVPEDGGGAVSLFIMFRWQRDWGFHTENGWVYWRDYLGLGPKESES